MTFSLTGFNTLKRDEIVLRVGFTATVSAEMQVGALEETVTVSGSSPLVDVQNTHQQEVLSTTLLETLPTGVKGVAMLSKLVPGLQERGADVGAASGLYISNYFAGDVFHGKMGMKLTYDGMQVNNLTGTGGSTSYAVNFSTVQETAIETGGVSAESDSNVVRVNLVPKEGGNGYSLDGSALYEPSLSTDNLSEDLQSRGVKNLNKLLYLNDVNITVGGPLKRDKLWFFAATRTAGSKNQVQGSTSTRRRARTSTRPISIGRAIAIPPSTARRSA